jgi:hypothetical protein
MLLVVAETHIGIIGNAGETNARRHKDSGTQGKQKRIGTGIRQPVLLERRMVLLHGDEGRRGTGSLATTLACQGGTGYNEDTK